MNRFKNCPTSHVIPGIFNVINVVRHSIPGDGTVFPNTNMADIRPFMLYFEVLNSIASLFCEIHVQTNTQPSLLRPSFAKLNLIINYRPTHYPTHPYFCAGDTVKIVLPSRLLF